MTEDIGKLHQVEVRGLFLDPNNDSTPVIILRAESLKAFLPIWIGAFEANAIAISLHNINLPRPLTHDLFVSALSHLDGKIDRVVVTELKDSTFFAVIDIDREGETHRVDARPSDAIALALKAEAPIFVSDTVLNEAKLLELPQESDEEKMKKWLENLSAEELGKYKM